MAMLILVKSKAGIEKLFIPASLSTYEGSIGYGGIQTPDDNCEDAARDYVNKLVDAGFYGTWRFELVDTQWPCNEDSSYKGCKVSHMHNITCLRSSIA
jgi:hypothetical protein